MNELFNQVWIQYGAVGLLIIALSIAVVVLWKRHNELQKSVLQIAIDAVEAIGGNTKALENLREVIKDLRK